MDTMQYDSVGYQALIKKANKMVLRKMKFNTKLGRSGLKTRDCRNGICIHMLCQVRLIMRRDGLQ